MIIGIQDEILKVYALGLLGRLLEDKTSKTNILWATDAYQKLGDDYRRDKEIKPYMITGNNSNVIKNRARKELEQQAERTKQRAEVFTPLWVCQKMIDHADEMWFKCADVFFTNGKPTERVEFGKRQKWQHYIDSRRLEITCGEAPFLATRYNVLTGEVLPLELRVGVLDRKLRVVNENAADEQEWLKWAIRALQATYGYEFQGDSLLIARLNMLMTFEEYLYIKWRRKPTEEEYQKVANIAAWNIWQMDGLTGRIPFCNAQQKIMEANLFDFEETQGDLQVQNVQPPCRIYDWRRGSSVEFLQLNSMGKGGRKNMKFDFIIGNPPYQDETIGDNKGYAPPIYNLFIEAVYKLADKVELIHPARFLFNAGSTSKEWNQKILSDEHFNILNYNANSEFFFPLLSTPIKGGIVISCRNKNKIYGAIEIFTPFKELNSIFKKIEPYSNELNISSICVTSYAYKFTKKSHDDFPEIVKCMSEGHSYDLTSNCFEKVPFLFSDSIPDDENIYVRLLGRYGNKRVLKYIRRDYINDVINFSAYKIFIPKANGAGKFGEVISEPVIAEPNVGSTETFMSIGNFSNKNETVNLLKYIKGKFSRALLGILKVTQDISPSKWKFVPLQDFTENSDIDWSKSIHEIDLQLYEKYGLDDNEINFIETHVKPME